jgi:hypothetical protein
MARHRRQSGIHRSNKHGHGLHRLEGSMHRMDHALTRGGPRIPGTSHRFGHGLRMPGLPGRHRAVAVPYSNKGGIRHRTYRGRRSGNPIKLRGGKLF